MFKDAIRFAQTALTQPVVVAPSLNLESTARVTTETLLQAIAESDGKLRLDKKATVDRLVIFDGKHGKVAMVAYDNGHTQNVPLGVLASERVVAGSSANLAGVLARMGTQAVGVIGAVGGGSDGETICHSLDDYGFKNVALLRRVDPDGAGGTAESLFLKTETGLTVGFSRKPAWSVTAETRQHFTDSLRARVVACTGFLPFDFPLVQALLAAPHPEARILSPHNGCFANAENRRQCLELAQKATLVHLNRDELAEWLELEADWDNTDETHLRDILAQIPAKLICVTCNSKGSLTYVRETDQLIRKSAEPVTRVSHPVGAGDVHLGALIWYLWLRDRRVQLSVALKAAAWVAARKVEFQGEDARPWDGIPDSAARKDIVHTAEEEFRKGERA